MFSRRVSHVATIGVLIGAAAAFPWQQYDRQLCQRPTPNPRQGCPYGTIVVGPSQDFSSIQEAVASLPGDDTPHTILIQPGNYTEQVNVTRHGPLTLLGVTTAPNNATQNMVNVIYANATGQGTGNTFDNALTSTLTIAPTLDSSLTGSGPDGHIVAPSTPFGNINFRTYNLNFINAWRPYGDGPALALSVSYANGGFYYTQFQSYQDTVYVGKLGNAYMYGSEIGGQTDFFYGFGTCWVTSSVVSLRGCGGGITAWKGTNTTFINKYGVYIHDSIVHKANSSLDLTGKCALGRPWNAQHRSIFANNYLDDSIRPSGYIEWSSTGPNINSNTTMAEYHDFGPGFNATGRAEAVGITIEMTPEQYSPYSTVDQVFQYPFSGRFGNTEWIDRNPSTGGRPFWGW